MVLQLLWGEHTGLLSLAGALEVSAISVCLGLPVSTAVLVKKMCSFLQYKGMLSLWISLIWQTFSLRFCLKFNLHHISSETTWSWREWSEPSCKARRLFYPFSIPFLSLFLSWWIPWKIKWNFHLSAVSKVISPEVSNRTSLWAYKNPFFNLKLLLMMEHN